MLEASNSVKCFVEMNSYKGAEPMKKITENTLLGDIVANFPGAGDYFIKRQIDFCCGGDRPLLKALRNLDMTRRYC